MAITKRPKDPSVLAKAPLDDKERERQEQAFVEGAPDVPVARAKSKRMQTVHLRFEPDLLPRMDDAARASGHDDRSAWIRFLVKQELKRMESAG